MTYSIAIAGCGVAGLTAALLLARQNHAVTVFEQSPQVGPVGAGVLLQPSGQMVLERLGLLHHIIPAAERIAYLRAVTHRRRALTHLPYAGAGAGLHALGVHRGALFAVLHAAALAAGVTVTLQCRVVRFVEDDRGIELFDDHSAARGRFDFLLAADGARSQLRAASSLPVSSHEYGHGVLWAQGPCAAIRGHLFQVCRGTQTLCGLLPMGHGRCTFFRSLLRDRHPSVLQRGFDHWRNDTLALIPEAAELLASLATFDDARFTTYLHVHMPRWHTRRMLLLGDAAHAMSPHLGQGINLALLDGLAIAGAIAATSTPRAAFLHYERLRRPHIRFYARVTRLLSPFFESRGVIKGWARDLALPILPHLPWIGPQMLLTMTGLKSSALGGRMTLPEPGAPAP